MKIENKIDLEKIKKPHLAFTSSALSQLKLILENDFTLAGKYFRLVISGKGCDGFTYSAGFTDLHEDDILVEAVLKNDLDLAKHEESLSKPIDPTGVFVAVDPFAAFYLYEVTVDYKLDLETNDEGFVVTNHHQKDYHGKFWKTKPDLTPPTKMESSLS